MVLVPDEQDLAQFMKLLKKNVFFFNFTRFQSVVTNSGTGVKNIFRQVLQLRPLWAK